MEAFANADGEGELACSFGIDSVESDLAHHGDVAARGRAELPVHAEVLHQIAPAVACTHKAATDAGESAIGRHGEGPLIFPGEEDFLAGDVHGAGGVPRSAVVEVRGQQSIDLQPGQQGRVAFKLNVGEDHGVMRVADDFLGDGVAAVGIAVDVADAESLDVDVFELRVQVPLFLVEKGLAVGDQKLHVADLGAVDGGVVDLVENSMRAGEPDPA